ncbi:MAG: aminoacetone oxidase family FAD-binding enzyme [Desulfamplus sp.]|nr:aminoacetone oxidase family FAD-binding enzyme [Desulfamplus sp.]
MLLIECEKVNVRFIMSCTVNKVEQTVSTQIDNMKQTVFDQIGSMKQTVFDQIGSMKQTSTEQAETDQNNAQQTENNVFNVLTSNGNYQCKSLVIATGGLSIPSAGATPFGYRIAEQFGIKIHPPRAALVPFTLNPTDKSMFAQLSGIAVDSIVKTGKQSFRENILFTHRGLSGPAILQISLYWSPGESITVNLLPEFNLFEWLIRQQQSFQNKKLKSILYDILPKRLVMALIEEKYGEAKLGGISHKDLRLITQKIQQLEIRPDGTEGYRTAEVTAGGVDCDCIYSKTMEARAVKGLFFTGEVLDVTGWLGGYNLQWAWSSGWCAGRAA